MLVGTEGIILKNRKYRETDSLLVIFTRKIGKVNAIAKGVQRPKSNLRAGVQPFCYSDFLLYKGRSLYTVSQCEPREVFYSIREDLKRLSYASYLVELVETVTNEGQTNNRLFNLLAKTLYILTEAEIEMDPIIRAFEIHFLEYSGFKPEFNQCINCGRSKSPSWKFSFQGGGVLCHLCFEEDLASRNISDLTLKLAIYLQAKDISDIKKLEINKNLNRALKELLRKYMAVHINKHSFKSLRLADQLF